jgi:seryl-tRNA synthetase
MTLADLRRAGDIEHVTGRLRLRGQALALFRWIDSQFEAMAVTAGAQILQAPTRINRDVLERAGYFEAFGEGASSTNTTASHNRELPLPAVCYHAYDRFADCRLETPLLLTSVGTCHRNESTSSSSITRLSEFTMREVIFIGAPKWVMEERRRWADSVVSLAAIWGLVGSVAIATDPFFLPAARGRQLMQQLKELKYELRLDVDSDHTGIAVASMNLHETFFGSRFGLTMANGELCASGCVAFGLERWTLALIGQLGLTRATALTQAANARVWTSALDSGQR